MQNLANNNVIPPTPVIPAKAGIKLFLVLLVFLTFQTGCNAQQQDQSALGYDRYTGQTREQTRENMKQTAQEVNALAQDFKTFYADLQEAWSQTGLANELGTGTVAEGTGFGKYDIILRDKDMQVIMDLPGIDKRELSVKLKGDRTLVVAGKRGDAGDETTLSSSRFRGEFSGEIDLPYASNGKKIKAEYDNGVLVVTIPREEEPIEKVVEVPIN